MGGWPRYWVPAFPLIFSYSAPYYVQTLLARNLLAVEVSCANNQELSAATSSEYQRIPKITHNAQHNALPSIFDFTVLTPLR